MAPPDKKAPTSAGRVSDASDTLTEALRAMSMRAAVDALDLSTRMKAIRDRFDGTMLAVGDSSEVSAAPRKEPGEVVYEAVKMHLQVANELMTFGQRQADFWLDRFQRLGTSVLPREQRPPVRLTCTVRSGEAATWRLFVYNAAHERREVRVTGRWRTLAKGSWTPTKQPPLVLPARAEKELTIVHPTDPALLGPGEYIAKGSVRMRGVGATSVPSLVVGRLELVLIVTG
jgi:hypothetical protein